MLNTKTIAALGGVALLLAGASACGSSSGATTTAPATAAATPTLAEGPQALGTTVTTSAGDTYTVLAFQTVQSKNELNTPAPGGAFSAADVKECAGSGHTLTTNPTEWTAVFSGNEESAGRDASLVATPGAAFPTGATVNSGQCVVGWVVFTRFADGIGRTVMLNGAGFSWTVP
jgi:hypothetical protein